MVELCAGLGIGTLGFNHAGMKTVCAADWCAPFAAAFCIPVVTGGIGDDKVLKQLFRLHSHPSTLMCGFSCQPFSTGRSLTLPKTLCAGYLFRSVAIILECVQDAGTNSMVRSLVDTFASQCGYHRDYPEPRRGVGVAPCSSVGCFDSSISRPRVAAELPCIRASVHSPRFVPKPPGSGAV